VALPGDLQVSVRIECTTLGDLLLKAWDGSPSKEALVFPEGRKTYDQVVRSVLDKARGLIGLGVQPGDHVGILLPSGIDFIETLFATAMIGGVSVLMNARYKPAELAYVAENADLSTIVTTDQNDEFVDFQGRLTAAFPGLRPCGDPSSLSIPAAPKLRRIILYGGTKADGFVDEARFQAAADHVDAHEVHRLRLRVRLRSTCMILYTSGTSAKPKGCLLSHEAVVREASNLTRNRWAFTEHERAWSPLPLYHVAAMLAMVGAIDVGGTFIGQPHFDAGESLRQIEAEKVTMMFLPFVTFHQAMIAHPDWAKTDMSSVRLQNSCFAFMPERVGQAYREKAPHMLQVGTFGMTEASGVVTTGGYDMDPEMGFQRLGYPLAGIEVRITDSGGRDLPVGERGEVLIRGYSLFDGYYKDPVRTAEVLDAEGWYHSGDIGSLDENGHLMFHGRFKDMLKVGGENVAAAEVEAVLAAHPAVRLAQVIGLPDERLAEIPAAYIERSGNSDASEAELIAYAQERLASFKVPRYIRFIDEWPMSASKIQKFKLRLELMNELGLKD
jgi:fatty-acyl-CoA synthase/long-chain acyl-CoA synthetase